MSEQVLYCSFCGKASGEVKKLIAGPTVYICDECVGTCVAVLIKNGIPISDGSVPVGMDVPVPMIMHCPDCSYRHIDKGEFETKPHHTHACQACGLVWRPAIVPTVGVRFLPGFKDEEHKS